MKVMKNILKKKEFLELLAKSYTPKKRKLLVEWGGPAAIHALSEIALNTLKGNIKLTPALFKKIKKCRNILRALSNKKYSQSKKKHLITQHGGMFLPYLLPAVLGAIPGLIGALKKK